MNPHINNYYTLYNPIMNIKILTKDYEIQLKMITVKYYFINNKIIYLQIIFRP